MLRYLLNKMLRSLNQRYDYDVRYQQEILNTDLVAFLKFSGFQTMSCHTGMNTSAKTWSRVLAANTSS